MSDQPLVERPPTSDISDRFRLMADRIDKNADASFAGAAVIIPPTGGGEPIEILMLDASGNVAQFWSAIQTRSQTAIEDLKTAQSRLHPGFGPR